MDKVSASSIGARGDPVGVRSARGSWLCFADQATRRELGAASRSGRVLTPPKLVLSTAVVLLFVAATSASFPSWGGVEVDKNVTLPVTIDKTWYRTGKARLFGKAYEQSGTLTVSDTGVDFSSNKGTVNIRRESITRIEWG